MTLFHLFLRSLSQTLRLRPGVNRFVKGGRLWQRDGEWVSIWRIVGQYSNLSIFDVRDNERLHEILWNLPLFPYMSIDVSPLAQHPSDISTV